MDEILLADTGAPSGNLQGMPRVSRQLRLIAELRKASREHSQMDTVDLRGTSRASRNRARGVRCSRICVKVMRIQIWQVGGAGEEKSGSAPDCLLVLEVEHGIAGCGIAQTVI